MVKLEIGGGNFNHPGWINVDCPLSSKRGNARIDVVHNLMEKKPLPFENNSVDIVYSEHTIEHITDDAAKYLFSDLHRILVPGGGLRIACPDVDIIYDDMLVTGRMERGYTKHIKSFKPCFAFMAIVASKLCHEFTPEAIDVICKTRGDNKKGLLAYLADLSNAITVEDQAKHPGIHVSWWSLEKMTQYMSDAGFRKIKQRGVRESTVDEFTESWMDKTGPDYSLRVECAK